MFIRKKNFKSFSEKKGLLIYLSSIKTELAINFLKKNFCTWSKIGLALIFGKKIKKLRNFIASLVFMLEIKILSTFFKPTD